MIGISDAKTAGLSPSNKAGEFGAELKATPIPVVSAALLALAVDNDNGKPTAASANDPVGHDAVQENLFTTGSGKTVGAQRESNQIAQLSPELVQAGTNMGKIEFERKEAEERKLEAVRDMIEAQQEAYWADREVEFGDISMTGAEWKQTAALMRTDSFKRTMRAKGKAAGYTDAQMDEAEKLAPEIADQLAKGKKPTPEQEAAMQRNPSIMAYVKESSQQVAEYGRKAQSNDAVISTQTVTAKAGLAAQESRINMTEDAGAARTPVAAGTDVEQTTDKTTSGLTASVAPLKPTYNAAANGVEVAPAVKPAVQVAVNSSAEMQGMGLDV